MAFNANLKKVYNDRYHWNDKFNKRIKDYFEKVKKNGTDEDDMNSDKTEEKVKGLSFLDLDQHILKQIPDIAAKKEKYIFEEDDDKAAKQLFLV